MSAKCVLSLRTWDGEFKVSDFKKNRVWKCQLPASSFGNWIHYIHLYVSNSMYLCIISMYLMCHPRDRLSPFLSLTLCLPPMYVCMCVCDCVCVSVCVSNSHGVKNRRQEAVCSVRSTNSIPFICFWFCFSVMKHSESPIRHKPYFFLKKKKARKYF